MPLLAVAGFGLSSLPRRTAALLVGAMLIPSLALRSWIRQPETWILVSDIEARVEPGDLAAVSWEHYLVVLDQGSAAVRSRLHVLSEAELPWYVGSAAYPPGAQIHAIPGDVIAGQGRIFWIADPGVAMPTLPPGYREVAARCVTLVCLTELGPGQPGD